mmetsp:Transcript_24526/g.78855  ORF Transcript_24526/g.78855 Transcript_24526/m.78855 type:complete len:464 (-) Transcript_24526:293-1684(-)
MVHDGCALQGSRATAVTANANANANTANEAIATDGAGHVTHQITRVGQPGCRCGHKAACIQRQLHLRRWLRLASLPIAVRRCLSIATSIWSWRQKGGEMGRSAWGCADGEETRGQLLGQGPLAVAISDRAAPFPRASPLGTIDVQLRPRAGSHQHSHRLVELDGDHGAKQACQNAGVLPPHRRRQGAQRGGCIAGEAGQQRFGDGFHQHRTKRRGGGAGGWDCAQQALPQQAPEQRLAKQEVLKLGRRLGREREGSGPVGRAAGRECRVQHAEGVARALATSGARTGDGGSGDPHPGPTRVSTATNPVGFGSGAVGFGVQSGSRARCNARLWEGARHWGQPVGGGEHIQQGQQLRDKRHQCVGCERRQAGAAKVGGGAGGVGEAARRWRAALQGPEMKHAQFLCHISRDGGCTQRGSIEHHIGQQHVELNAAEQPGRQAVSWRLVRTTGATVAKLATQSERQP